VVKPQPSVLGIFKKLVGCNLLWCDAINLPLQVLLHIDHLIELLKIQRLHLSGDNIISQIIQESLPEDPNKFPNVSLLGLVQLKLPKRLLRLTSILKHIPNIISHKKYTFDKN
jgi:hypothetical protein